MKLERQSMQINPPEKKDHGKKLDRITSLSGSQLPQLNPILLENKKKGQEQIVSNQNLTLQQCGIRQRYLNIKNYLDTFQFARQRNGLYKEYCCILQEYYKNCKDLGDRVKIHLKASLQKKERHHYVVEFKQFAVEFFQIFREIAGVHIDYFNEILFNFARKDTALEEITQQFLDGVKMYAKKQVDHEQTYKKYSSKLDEVYLVYQHLKRDEANPLAYFNKRHLNKKAKELLDQVEKQEKVKQQLRNVQTVVYRNSENFEKDLVMYRQLLFANKHKIIKKLVAMESNAKNALMELLIYLFNCASQKYSTFLEHTKSVEESTRKRKKSRALVNVDDRLAVESYLTETTQDYLNAINAVEQTLKVIAECLEEFRKATGQLGQRNQKLVNQLNTLYEAEENPNKEIANTIDLYSYFCKKVSELINGVNFATNELVKTKNEAKKLSDITLTLARNRKNSSDGLSENNDQTVQIEVLLEKLSHEYPVNIVQKVYKHFQESLGLLKSKIASHTLKKKRNIENSMEISHVEETYLKPIKKPCKREEWLWGNWKEQEAFRISSNKQKFIEQCCELAQALISEIPEEEQQCRFSCIVLDKHQSNGFLITTSKYLKFEASNRSLALIIPFREIETLNKQVKTFVGKVLEVKTEHGNLFFKNFINIEKVLETIEEALEQDGEKAQKVPVRVVYELQPEELLAIDKKQEKIAKELPVKEQFILHEEVQLPDITIDHVYQLIYSDKECKIKNTCYDCFFGYPMQKVGAANFKAKPFKPPGPQFYTGQEGVTFVNCPIFSQRQVSYDVKLPPIPFMPSYAQSHQLSKIFWVSNNEFQYLIHSTSKGPPKADTFFVQILHRVWQEGTSVRVNVYWRIVFTQDSYLKSTLNSQAGAQTKKNISLTMEEVKRYCKKMKGKAFEKNIEDLAIDQQQEQDTEKLVQKTGFVEYLLGKIKVLSPGSKKQVQGQRNSTAILALVLIVVLIANLVLQNF